MLEDNQELDTLRRTAKEILVAAVKNIFLDAIPIEGKVSSIGFYYDFIFPYPIHPQMKPLIEEEMKKICKEKKEINTLQMLLSNAILYLKHLGYNYSFEDQQDQLIEIFQFDNFANISQGPFLQNTSDVQFFRVLEIYFIENNQKLRIEGSAFFSKKELVEQCKRYQLYKKNNHLTIGEKEQLFFLKDQIVFLPKALEYLDYIFKHIQNMIKAKGCMFVKTFEGKENAHIELFFKKKYCHLAEVFYLNQKNECSNSLLDMKKNLSIVEKIFVFEEKALEACISSLIFIQEILNIFCFGYKIKVVDFLTNNKRRKKNSFVNKKVLPKALLHLKIIPDEDYRNNLMNKCQRIEFFVEDGLGRSWLLAYMQIKPLSKNAKDSIIMIERSVVYSFERLIALLLEKNNGLGLLKSKLK